MKKLAVIGCIVLLLFTVSCSKDNQVVDELNTTDLNVEEPVQDAGEISVDEGLVDVEITLPESFFEGETFEEVESEALGDGVKKVVQNDDGSYTYTISKKKHREMMIELKTEIESEIVSAYTDYPSVKDITNNDDFSKFTVTVNKTDYEGGYDSFVTLGLGLSGMFYQTFDGVASDDAKVVIDVVDQDTNEIIASIVYPDAMNEWDE